MVNLNFYDINDTFYVLLNVTLTLMKSDWMSCANPVSKSYRGSKHSGSYFDTCDFNSSKIWNISINVLESKGYQKLAF